MRKQMDLVMTRSLRNMQSKDTEIFIHVLQQSCVLVVKPKYLLKMRVWVAQSV